MRVHPFDKTTRVFALISFLLGHVLSGPVPAQPSVSSVRPVSVNTPAADPYHPALIRGLSLHPDNPLRMDFLIDTGGDDVRGEGSDTRNCKLSSLAGLRDITDCEQYD